jgi:rSAM/selenodomain-associated transferase 2
MRASIVMPTLNEAEGIVAALERLDDWRRAGNEVIVADGGSVDGTAALAVPYCDDVLRCPSGRARQMNTGAAAARGDVLVFLHADTELPAHALDAIRSALAPGWRAWGRFDVRIRGAGLLFPVIAFFMNIRSRLSGIATGDQAIFVRREAFERLGGYAEIPLMEDIELSRRLCRLSRPACLRERVTTSGRRWERHGLWRTIVLMWELRLRYWLGADPVVLARRYAAR